METKKESVILNTEDEKRAFILMKYWLELSKKIFPDINHLKVSKNPKTSHIFKVCYKLQRLTRNILVEDDYYFYVKAQLDIIRHLRTLGAEANVDVNCLVGDKAWKRWKVWKKKFDEKSLVKKTEVNINENKVLALLLKTKSNLDFDYKNYEVMKENKQKILDLLRSGKISGYYLALSNNFSKLIEEDPNFLNQLGIDLKVYKEPLTESIKTSFIKIFGNEN